MGIFKTVLSPNCGWIIAVCLSHRVHVQVSKFTFAKVFGIERQAVSRQRLQQQLVAGPPAGLWDGGSDALHGRNTLEEGWLATEADQLVELRQDTVALNLLLLRQLQLERKQLPY